MEKLKCIRTTDKTNPYQFKRIEEGIAKELVSTGDYVFTSKSAYKRWIKEQNHISYTSGIFGSSNKINSSNSNNKKRSRGYNVKYDDISYKSVVIKVKELVTNKGIKIYKNVIRQMKKVREIKHDIVTITHKSKLYLKSTDPITGKKLYSKKGRAIVDSTRTVFKKGDKLPIKGRTVKHIIKSAKDIRLEKLIPNS